MRHQIRLVQLGAAPLVRIVSRSPAAVRHRTDWRRTCLASYGLCWASTLSPHRRHVEAVLHNAPGPTKDTDEAPGTDKATCSGKLQSEGEGGGERPQGQPPERRPRASGFVVNGVGVLEILTLPARHLVWTVTMATLAVRFPAVWERAAFYEGAAQAVQYVFQCLAAQDLPALHGPVDAELLGRLRQDLDRQGEEHWDMKPELKEVFILGLLRSAVITDSEGEQPRAELEVLVATKEAYGYDSSQPTREVEVRRLTCWTFERPFGEDGGWTVTGLSAKPWYFSPGLWGAEP